MTSKNKKIWIVFHGRFPGEKAAALFASEEAKSFAQYTQVTLLVPRRFGRLSISAKEYYALPEKVHVTYLPTIDFFSVPKLQYIAFIFSYIAFSISCFIYALFKIRSDDFIITNEPLPALFLTFISKNICIEIHDFPEHYRRVYRFLFKRVRIVLATNTWKKDKIIQHFLIPKDQVIIVRNGVDLSLFESRNCNKVRKELGLPLEELIVLYTGHLYTHKGVDTLAEAAKLIPKVQIYFVGGTNSDCQQFKKRYRDTHNVHIMGYRPHHEMPLWQSAANVLVIPNSGKESISAWYTSPMKLFEYMAIGRPIVASDVPAIREVLSADAGYLIHPDDVSALAKGISQALVDKKSALKVNLAISESKKYTWSNRANRILSAMNYL